MNLTLGTPIPPSAPVATIQLVTSVYQFQTNTITIGWNELDASGNLIAGRGAVLTPAQVGAFFATALAPTFQETFVAAFLGAIEPLYGPVTVASP